MTIFLTIHVLQFYVNTSYIRKRFHPFRRLVKKTPYTVGPKPPKFSFTH